MAFWQLRVHQIRFRPGLLPGPYWGAYSAPPGPLAGLRSPTYKGEGRERGKEEGNGREREWEGPAPLSQIPGYVPVKYI